MSTTCPNWQGTLHAALGLSPVAHGRLLAVDVARLRARARRGGVLAADDIPGTNDCGPSCKGDDPILAAWQRPRYLGQPVFAVVATPARAARRAAARAKEFLTLEPLPALLTPRDAHAAQQYVVPPMHLARGDAAAAAGSTGRAAPAARQPERRRAGAVLPGRPDQLCGAAGRRHAAAALFHPAPERDAAPGGACAGPTRTRCRWSAGAWAAALAARNRRARCSACVAAVAAARLRRPVKLRLDRDDDFMVTGKRHGFEFDYDVGYDDAGRVLGAQIDAGRQRRLLGRPEPAGDDARVCHFDNAYWLPRRGHARLLRAHQHAEQHRLPRLRRAAGR
jgi:xanthine dehydrogenase large subunit